MQIKHKDYTFDLSKPIDISIAIKNGNNNPKAFYGPDTILEPVRTDEFVGSTKEGGILNFKNVFLNPHGNGTHTECLGHITEEIYSINKTLTEYFFNAKIFFLSQSSPFKVLYPNLFISFAIVTFVIFVSKILRC